MNSVAIFPVSSRFPCSMLDILRRLTLTSGALRPSINSKAQSGSWVELSSSMDMASATEQCLRVDKVCGAITRTLYKKIVACQTSYNVCYSLYLPFQPYSDTTIAGDAVKHNSTRVATNVGGRQKCWTLSATQTKASNDRGMG